MAKPNYAFEKRQKELAKKKKKEEKRMKKSEEGHSQPHGGSMAPLAESDAAPGDST